MTETVMVSAISARVVNGRVGDAMRWQVPSGRQEEYGECGVVASRRSGCSERRGTRSVRFGGRSARHDTCNE